MNNNYIKEDNNKIDKNNDSFKKFPNYKKQIDEINSLKSYLQNKVKILKEKPNFIIQIDIKGNSSEESIKKFILTIYLNCDYPDKSPDSIEIYEMNKKIANERLNIINNKILEYCNINIGKCIIFKLYEICKEFADEEENILLLKKKEKDKKSNPYQLDNLKEIKIIKEIPIDILLLKNKNILIINQKNKIVIYDNLFLNKLYEISLSKYSLNHIIFCKYYPSQEKKYNDFLYLFTIKDILIFQIRYLSQEIIEKNSKIKNNGIIKLCFIQKIEYISDLIEIPQYIDSIFFINNKNKDFLLYEYNKIINNNKLFIEFNKGIIENKSRKIFRKIYRINDEKCIIASYTLKIKKNDQYIIEGINKIFFVDIINLIISKEYNLKISPLKYSITNYKDKYLIISYFNTINNINTNNETSNSIHKEQYDFEDNNYIRLFHDFSHSEKVYEMDEFDMFYGYRDKFATIYDYDAYESKYYSYDITEHRIGIFNIKTEELVTIIDFDVIKRIYNINNNFLCLIEKRKNKKQKEQIMNERIFHHYFNDIPIKESNLAKYYRRENYLYFLLFTDGIEISQQKLISEDITCFLEVESNFIAIGSNKKGIILYRNMH